MRLFRIRCRRCCMHANRQISMLVPGILVYGDGLVRLPTAAARYHRQPQQARVGSGRSTVAPPQPLARELRFAECPRSKVRSGEQAVPLVPRGVGHSIERSAGARSRYDLVQRTLRATAGTHGAQEDVPGGWAAAELLAAREKRRGLIRRATASSLRASHHGRGQQRRRQALLRLCEPLRQQGHACGGTRRVPVAPGAHRRKDPRPLLRA